VSERAVAEAAGAVGCGRMGRGIAAAYAMAGQSFVLIDLRDRTPEARNALHASVRADLSAIFEQLSSLGLATADQIDRMLERVKVVDRSDAASALRQITLLFEAVPETLEAKREALRAVSSHLPATAFLASTSSTMLASELAGMVERLDRFLNAHWLNPAYLIPLVEVAPHSATAKWARDRMMVALSAVSKVPVLCGDQPGYIVPRLQALIMNEAARMVEQGAATAEEIDKAVRYGFGLRYAAMGVVEFIDFGGVDILFHGSRYLAARHGDARYESPVIVDRHMAADELGIKTGKGFYDWPQEKARAFQKEATQRLVRLLRLAGVEPRCQA